MKTILLILFFLIPFAWLFHAAWEANKFRKLQTEEERKKFCEEANQMWI